MTALDLIQRFEGCHKVRPDGRMEAYRCPAGVPTIGWGSTGPDVTMATVWTRAECDARLARDADRFSRGVKVASPAAAGDVLTALTSFSYNLGIGAYQTSTLRRKVNERDFAEAGRQIRRWNRAGGRILPGLVIRREAEALLLERG